MVVAIYCRLSEEDKNKQQYGDDSESIQNQKTMLLDYATKKNWEIFDIYSDDDYTGADRKRPEFNRLLKDAEDKKFNIILCKSQSRFTREMEMVEKYLHFLFPIWNIRFISIVDNADTENKGNKKARQINGLINEWYLEDLSDNIKSVFKMKKEKGYHIGAFALYGYIKDPNQKGHLVIDENVSHIVREVFELFASGMGKINIARLLNERGIPNPTEYKFQSGLIKKKPKHKQGTLWKYYAISDMLTNAIYIGHMVQNRYHSVSYKTKKNKPNPKSEWIIVENTHEPIIDMELWNRVQALIKQKAKPFKIGKIGLFAKKVKCMTCLYTMRSCKNHNLHYLKCETKYSDKNACVGAFISVNTLEQVVLKELNSHIKKYINSNEIAERIEIHDNMNLKLKDMKTQISSYRQKQAENINAMKSLYLDKTKNIITDIEYFELKKAFQDEFEKYDDLIKELRDHKERIELNLNSSNDKSEILEKYLDLKKLEREHIDVLISFILIGKKDPETKEIPIEINWNF